MNKRTGLALIDTGASVSLISEQLIRPQLSSVKRYDHKVRDASGNLLPIVGQLSVKVNTPDGSVSENVLIYKGRSMDKIKILLGMNILRYATIDLLLGKLSFDFKNTGRKTTTEGLQLTIMCRKIREMTPRNAKSRVTHGVYVESNAQELTEKNKSRTEPTQPKVSLTTPIHLMEDVTLPENAMTIKTIKIGGRWSDGQAIVLENAELRQRVVSATVVTTVQNGEVVVNLVNINDHPVVLKQGTRLCNAYRYDAGGVDESVRASKDIPGGKSEDSELMLPDLTDEDINCGDLDAKPKLVTLLNRYRGTCWMKGEPLGCYKGDPLEIKLKEDVIINKPPYRIPHARQEKLDGVIKDMLEEGIITRSKSSFNSPLIIVQKPGGDIRPCIDYRALNSVTVPITFPIPRISDLLNSLGQSKIISSLDLASAYHQCSIKESDREKTAFTVRQTRYHFNRVPFGLTSAPGYFSRIINEVLYDIIGVQVVCYLDDLIIFSKNNEEHFKRLEEVLVRLADANIKLKLSKCHFFTREVKFLGYRITQDGMKMDEARVKAIEQMPYPENKRQLQSFLGACNYFRIFVRQFAKTAEPLYELLRKDVKFKWTERQSKAVDEIKDRLCNSPILRFPDFNKEFHIHTDASLTGIGACLLQEHEGMLHPVSYVSKCLSDTQRKYSATKREALALVFALEQFRHLILYYPVHVYTDHQPLKGVINKPTKDACLTRWSLLVQEYAIQLHYLPGKNNLFADCLSRLSDVRQNAAHVPNELDQKLIERVNLCDELNSFIPEKVPWSERDLRRRQNSDKNCTDIKNSLKDNSTNTVKLIRFKVVKGILFIHRSIKRGQFINEYLVPYIPDTLMRDALKVVHDDTTAGHKGFERTLNLFRKNFYNAKESLIIKEFCNKCEACIKAKSTPKPIPIEKYPIPEIPFHTVSSDILGPLPVTVNNNRYILVVRDFATRYTVLSALKSKEADSVINALRHVIANYGASKTLITDNAKEYVSEKLQAFCRFYNMKKIEIAPYHPASQGLAERINREITKLLRIYTNQLASNDWDELLPVLQLTINSTFNASLGEAPFFALFGYDSPTISLTAPKLNYDESDLNLRLQRVAKVREHCRKTLLESQSQYTNYTNTKRSPKKITVGQRVYAKLDKQAKRHKLDWPVSGPFVVIGNRGRALKLKDVKTKGIIEVHPDYIIDVCDISLVDKTTHQDQQVAIPPVAQKKLSYNLRPRK